MSFVSSNFCIVADKLFWKGQEVVGVVNINYRKNGKDTRVSIIIEGGDPTVISEMQLTGIIVRSR